LAFSFFFPFRRLFAFFVFSFFESLTCYCPFLIFFSPFFSPQGPFQSNFYFDPSPHAPLFTLFLLSLANFRSTIPVFVPCPYLSVPSRRSLPCMWFLKERGSIVLILSLAYVLSLVVFQDNLHPSLHAPLFVHFFFTYFFFPVSPHWLNYFFALFLLFCFLFF